MQRGCLSSSTAVTQHSYGAPYILQLGPRFGHVLSLGALLAYDEEIRIDSGSIARRTESQVSSRRE